MAQDLLDGIYITGPKDDLIVTDVYAPIPASPAAAAASAAASTDSPAAAASAPVSAGAAAVVAETTSKSEPPTLPEPSVDRITTAMNNSSVKEGTSSQLGAMSDKLTDAIIKQTKVNDLKQNQVVDLANRVISKNGDASTEEVEELTDIVTELYCDSFSKLRDLAAEYAALDVMIGLAIGLGTNGLLDCLLTKVLDLDKNVLIKHADSAIKKGNLDALVSIESVTGESRLKSKYPNMINDTLTSFVTKPVSVGGDKTTQSTALVNNLNFLDPNWQTTTVNGNPVQNLASITDMSSDAKELLLLNESTRDSAMIASDYGWQDLLSTAKTTFTSMSA